MSRKPATTNDLTVMVVTRLHHQASQLIIHCFQEIEGSDGRFSEIHPALDVQSEIGIDKGTPVSCAIWSAAATGDTEIVWRNLSAMMEVGRVIVIEAVIKEQLVGLLLGSVEQSFGSHDRYGSIHLAFVEQDVRGDRVCRRMVDRFREELQDSGCKVIWADVMTLNAQAEEIWRRLGFDPVYSAMRATLATELDSAD